MRVVIVTLVLILSGCDSMQATHRAAPTRPLLHLIKIIPGAVTAFVNDSSTGSEYGIDKDGIFRLDAQLHVQRVQTAPARTLYLGLALAGPDRLLVVAEHCGQTRSHSPRAAMPITIYLDIVGLFHRDMVHRVLLASYRGGCFLGIPAALAVDSALGRAYVDACGFDRLVPPVVVDTRSGRVIAHPSRAQFAPFANLTILDAVAVDPHRHLAYVPVNDPTPAAHVKPVGMAVVDLRSGRTVHQFHNVGADDGMVFDSADERVVTHQWFDSVYLVDGRSWKPVRVIHMPGGFQSLENPIVADGMAHHAFLFGLRGQVLSHLKVHLLRVNVNSGEVTDMGSVGTGYDGSIDQVDLVVDLAPHILYVFNYPFIRAFRSTTGRLLGAYRIVSPTTWPGYRFTLDGVHHRLFVWGGEGAAIFE